MNRKITIAIDGWSSCGKSTLAKSLAKRLDYLYVDSGAMYRGIALHAMRKGLLDEKWMKKEEIIASLSGITLNFLYQDGRTELLLNKERVEDEIRTIEVSKVVSSIAKIREIRQFLVSQQRWMGRNGGVVMDGRDIGSVVFPKAELKLFLTASPSIRAQRRFEELRNKGENVSYEEVLNNLESRDEMDANRVESPLIQTEDAIVIDNSNLTPEEQLEKSLELVDKVQET